MKLGPKFVGPALVLSLGFGAFCETSALEPPGYYEAAAGKTGGELKQALHEIIRRDNRFGLSSHTVVPYVSLLQPLREIWRDSANASNISLIYSSSPVDAFSAWNREHLWPRARGNTDNAGPDDSDLFHVLPSDSQVNGLRGNLYFDLSDVNDPKYVIGAGTSAPQVSYDSDSWQPPPDQRGDIARALFYMDVRYNGTELNTTDLELVSFAPSGSQMGQLNTLLLWNAADPPDDAERARNDLIYSNYQGNRNPFIDHPEYITAIWGTGIPGDPQSAPMASVRVTSDTASELPYSPARFLVSLNQFAGSDGLVVNFSMSGTAAFSEYSLSGDGANEVGYDPATGLGFVKVAPGYATAAIVLAPLADEVPEEAETALLSLVAAAGYEFTPDSSSYATVTIRDAPSLPASWNFDSISNGAKILPANQGFGFVSLSNWTGAVSNYGGRSGNSLSLVGSSGNGSFVDFNFSMVGYRNLSLSFYTRGTSSGFTTGLWSFSTDGTNFATNSFANTATTSTSWVFRSLDFSSYLSINNAPQVTLRYTLSGATSGSGNNRIDDLLLSASLLSATSNDLFSDGAVISGVSATAGGSNAGATRESGEPWHYSNTGSASVWWRWTASAAGVVSLSTAGSTFDTILAVYTGSAVSSLTRIVSDDDSGGGGTSKVTFSAVAGTTYMIAVDGYGTATGDIALSLTQSASPVVSSFSPTAGVPGTVVTINGFNFQQATSVAFGTVEAQFTVVSETQILATVPSGANSDLIYVWSPDGSGQSSSRFGVARLPSVPSASPDRGSLPGLASVQGTASPLSTLSVSASNLPAPLRIAAPAGFEVSLDGRNFTDVVEFSAPERSDSAASYPPAWTNGDNAGNGFAAWYLFTSQGTGAAGTVVGNPADSGITGFGDRAFSLFAGPVNSGAYAMASRLLNSPLAVGDCFSFRWAVNWDPNTSSGYNYFNLGSGGANLVTIWQGNNPGPIYFRASGGATVNTGIAYGTGPMTWTFKLITENTLRVTATRRDGTGDVVFTRDVTVAGAPDYFVWYAYQTDDDVRRRLYFNDLRIDSASPGGGSFGDQTVYVRLAATAPVGDLSGALDISSGGQSLASVAVSGTVTGVTNPYDAWVQSHGLDPQGNGARAEDADGDGYSNRVEFAFGKAPNTANASLVEAKPAGGLFTISYLARETGVTYKIQRSGDLRSGFVNATEAAPAVSASQGGVPSGWRRMEFSVPVSGAAFYRIQASGE